MGAEQYKVYFRGEIIQSYTIVQLKRNLATLFKLPHEKIERMFTEQTVIVQPAVNKQTAAATERISNEYFIEMLKDICGLPERPDAFGEKLKELKDLYDAGVITEEEFLQKREKYLAQL